MYFSTLWVSFLVTTSTTTFSRNLCLKKARENVCDFHTVVQVLHYLLYKHFSLYHQSNNFSYSRWIRSFNRNKEDDRSTVWKSHNFSVTQILREIQISESKDSKSTIFTFGGSEFEFSMNFYTFWKLKFTKLKNSKPQKLQKRQFL